VASIYEDYANQNRLRAMQQGDVLQSQLTGDINMYRPVYAGAYNMANQGLMDLGVTPGYTPQEQADIMRNTQFQQLQDQPDYSSNYLTPWEQGAIAGDPYAAMKYYDPGAISGVAGQGAAATRGTVADTSGRLRSNVSQTGQDLSAAIDPTKLGVSSQYGTNVSDLLNTTANRVEGSIDPAKLGITDAYSKAMQFSPQDQQNIIAQAATAEANRYGGQIDALRRQAIQQGNTSPAALAALQEQLNVQEGSAAGDAATSAAIRAKQAAQTAAGQLEQTRLSAEQFQTGQGVQAGEALGGLAAQEVGQQEQLRMGGEQDIASRLAQAATTRGQMSQQAEEFGGAEALTNEQQIAARNLAVEQQNQATGQNLATQADVLGSQRQAELAQNRQNINLQDQAAQFNRGFQTQQQLSQNAQQIANARRQGGQALIQGATQQQQLAQGGIQGARGQQIGAFGTSGQLANQAAQTGLTANRTPGLGERLFGTIIGGAQAAAKAGAMGQDGGVFGLNGPETVTLGERGDEMVMPINRGLNPPLDITQQTPRGVQPYSQRTFSPPQTARGSQDFSLPPPPSGPEAPQPLASGIDRSQQSPSVTPAILGPTSSYDTGVQSQDFDYSTTAHGSQSAGPDAGASGRPLWMRMALGGLGGAAGAQRTPRYGGGGYQGYGGLQRNLRATDQFAGGKIVTRPTTAILGENGPEMVVPFQRSGGTKVSTNVLGPKSSATMFSEGKGVRSRFKHPSGPVGPQGPLRSLLPLKPLGVYR
jgi:hypothetical protein